VNGLDELVSIAKTLHPNRLGVLIDLARALQRKIDVKINPHSDLMSAAFVEDFSARLIAYHALHEQKLTKKTFEFVFCGACRAGGKNAIITSSPVNPGADVTVDGVRYSLKTEGAAGMNKSSITISKLMEARWIRECQNPVDFAREASRRISEHLQHYQRIITLRAFEYNSMIEYDLVEIPLPILQSVEKLKASDFAPRTRNGGSSAQIVRDGRQVFTLRLDGSVEKVTVSNLRTDVCGIHGSWRIERETKQNDNDD